MSYISDTLTEKEYLEQRRKKSSCSSLLVQSVINQLKFFTKDYYQRDFETVLSDLRVEVDKTHKVEKVLVFLQKFVDWLDEDHPNILQPANNVGTKRPVLRKSVATISNYLAQARKYLKRVGGINVSPEDVSDFVILPSEGEREEVEPLEPEELRLIIENQKTAKRKSLYMVKKDTCSRIRAMVQLRKKDFDMTKDPPVVTFPKHIMKGKRATSKKYLTPETTPGVRQQLKMIEDNDLVYGSNENPKTAVNTEEKIWNKLVKELGFTEKYSHNGRIKKNIHSIKAFTETQAEEAVNEAYANAYGDHNRYLPNYIRWTEQKKIDKFRAMQPLISLFDKAPEVTDQSEQLKEINKKLEKYQMLDKLIENIEQPKLEELLKNLSKN